MFPITQCFITGHNRTNKKLNALRAIIIHWTANTNKGANAMANRNYFNNKHLTPSGSLVYASAHYNVDSTCIIQCLPDDEVGYHVGAKASRYTAIARKLMGEFTSPNFVTIGIEMCVNSDGDFDITRKQTAELTLYLANKYGLGRGDIFRHYDITGKDCPRMMIEEAAWSAFLDEVFAVEPTNYRVCSGVVNVRGGAGTNFPIVGKVSMNQVVKVIEKSGQWFKIGDKQFVHGSFLEPADADVEVPSELELKSVVAPVASAAPTGATATATDAAPNKIFKAFKINVSELNVRGGAGVDFPVVKKLAMDEVVPYIEAVGSWVKIGENEFVNGDYLVEVMSPGVKPKPDPLVRFRVNAPILNVRSGAGSDFPVVKKVISGDIVTLVEKVGPWFKIGEGEFVHSDFVVTV